MADISKIQTNGETYDIKDAEARDDISSLNDDLTNNKVVEKAKNISKLDSQERIHITFGATGWTALDAIPNDGDTIYRLQVSQTGTVQFMRSTDGGSTWPADDRITIATFS